MASREELDLQRVIDTYQEQKADMALLDKETKSKNAFIKKKLAEMEIDLYETSKNKATISYTNKVSMDEEKVIEIIKENINEEKRNGVIKIKEYVDYEILEGLIYNGVISAEKLEPAQSVKTTVVLNVKPLKKGKEDE